MTTIFARLAASAAGAAALVLATLQPVAAGHAAPYGYGYGQGYGYGYGAPHGHAGHPYPAPNPYYGGAYGGYDPHHAGYGDCYRDERNEALATGLGAALGGILGSQFGNGRDDRVAATIGGVVLGGIIGNAVSQDGGCDNRYADRYYYDRAYYDSLERGHRADWRNPHTQSYGYFRPVRTYYVDDDHGRRHHPRGGYRQVCREYAQTVWIGGRQQTAYGTACRAPDGTWQIQN